MLIRYNFFFGTSLKKSVGWSGKFILLENNNDSVLMGLNLTSHITAQLKSFSKSKFSIYAAVREICDYI